MIHRIGFPCVMHAQKRSTNHAFRLASLSEERLSETVNRNLDDMTAILEWMSATELRLFRIGSSFVPFASHDKMTYDWPSMVGPRLAELGRRFEPMGFRFSLHPGQYTVLNSEKPDVVRRAAAESAYSAQVLDLMGLDASHKIVMHGGCECGDLAASKDRLVDAILALPTNVRARLILENDERFFALADILDVCEGAAVPAVFDIFHHDLLPGGDLAEMLDRIVATWAETDGRPKMHISSQRDGARTGAHADRITAEDVAGFCRRVPHDVDLMVEAKHKETAALEVLEIARSLEGCVHAG